MLCSTGWVVSSLFHFTMYLSLTIQSVFAKGTEIDKDKQKDGIVSILFDLTLIENAEELLRLNISISQSVSRDSPGSGPLIQELRKTFHISANALLQSTEMKRTFVFWCPMSVNLYWSTAAVQNLFTPRIPKESFKVSNPNVPSETFLVKFHSRLETFPTFLRVGHFGRVACLHTE